jgi:hypothetical protein
MRTQVWSLQRGDYKLGLLRVCLLSPYNDVVRSTFYSLSGRGVLYSLIILGLTYIKSDDPAELLESAMDSGFIIAVWPVPSALLEGAMFHLLSLRHS